MDENTMFITTSNINRFRKLLQQSLSTETRRTIEGLLVDAELDLAQGVEGRACCVQLLAGC